MKKDDLRPGPKNKKPGSPQNDDASRNEESLESSSPTDNRSDEKVIVNEQRSNKTVNAPSQTAPHTGENIGSDEEIINR